MESNNNNNFNIYTFFDVFLEYWKFIILIPALSIIFLFLYFYMFPQPSTGTYTVIINNENIYNKNYNKILSTNFGKKLDINLITDKKKNLDDEEEKSQFTQLIYSILNSNKFLKNILTSFEFLNYKTPNFEDNNFNDYTSDFIIDVIRDENANIDIIKVYLILPINDIQMKKIGAKIFQDLDINIKQQIKILIESKITELDLLYKVSKLEIESEIEKRTSEISIQENLAKQDTTSKDFIEFTDYSLYNKQILNKLIMAQYDIENDYIVNLDFIENLKVNLKNNAYSIDRENVKYEYNAYYRPYFLYVSLTFLISFIIALIIFTLIQGYKKHRSN